MLVGVPPVAANATSTVALLPGYVASAWGFREDLRGRRDVRLWPIVFASLAGGVIGAVLLLYTSNAVFRVIVPWLMLVATLWFALWPLVEPRLGSTAGAGTATTFAGVLAVSIYGGYFNGGLGIILLALLGALGFADLNHMNGIKSLISAILTAIAVVVYVLGSAVVWADAALMMAAAIAGGYAGARWARRVPPTYLRYGIVAVGATMTAAFFVRW